MGTIKSSITVLLLYRIFYDFNIYKKQYYNDKTIKNISNWVCKNLYVINTRVFQYFTSRKYKK